MEEFKFHVTDSAVLALKKSKLSENAPYIRIGVLGSGCSGYSYSIQFELKDPKSKDFIFIFDTLKILIDNKSIMYLNNTTLDYENTLIKKGFKFNNPNAKSQCGCGESFSTI